MLELIDSLAATNTPDTSGLSAFAADPEMVAEFVTESREHLVDVEQRLLLIEKDASDLESVNSVFRGIHTIKGLAGFLELKSIQSIAHEVETLLDHARSQRLILTPPRVDVLLGAVDYLAVEITRVQRQAAGEVDRPPASNADLLLSLGAVAKEATLLVEVDPRKIVDQHTATSQQTKLPVAATPTQAIGEDKRQQPTSGHADDSTVRIETAKLDRLMDAVGELVIAQTLVSHNQQVAALRDPRLLSDLALLHRITEEIQRTATSMRMVPIRLQFQKTARLVRELSRQVGKQVLLSTIGEDTELDKTITEELAGPLLHMVRNSIDHGIEGPQERILAGKEPTAQIRLAAYHEASQVVIEISDDGRGLNRERILAKAVDRNLIPPGAQLSDMQIFQLIFAPGFSTAEKVTEISGRGVGMDVVQRHVQRLRGRIEIESRMGFGTTFFLKFPLTFALIEGLVVLVGDSSYILPITSVIEIFCATESQISSTISGDETVRLRGEEVPVIRLHDRFQIKPRSTNVADGVLVITEAHGKRFCLFLDEMLGKQEIVVKSLGSAFKQSKELMGCAILSDGRIGLILDVNGIMR